MYLGFYLHVKLNLKHPHCAVTKALLLFAKLHVAAVVFFRRASQEGQWTS